MLNSMHPKHHPIAAITPQHESLATPPMPSTPSTNNASWEKYSFTRRSVYIAQQKPPVGGWVLTGSRVAVGRRIRVWPIASVASPAARAPAPAGSSPVTGRAGGSRLLTRSRVRGLAPAAVMDVGAVIHGRIVNTNPCADERP